MSQTYQNFKPLEDVFLLAEHTLSVDFAEKAPPTENNETVVHKISMRSIQDGGKRPWM